MYTVNYDAYKDGAFIGHVSARACSWLSSHAAAEAGRERDLAAHGGPVRGVPRREQRRRVLHGRAREPAHHAGVGGLRAAYDRRVLWPRRPPQARQPASSPTRSEICRTMMHRRESASGAAIGGPKPTRLLDAAIDRLRRDRACTSARHASKMQGKGGRWRQTAAIEDEGSSRRCSATARRWTRCPSRCRKGRSFPSSARTAPGRPRCCACCPRCRAPTVGSASLWASTCEGRTRQRRASTSGSSRTTPCSIPTLRPSRTCMLYAQLYGVADPPRRA